MAVIILYWAVLFTGYAVTLVGPLSQIDETAAFTTEGPPGTLL